MRYLKTFEKYKIEGNIFYHGSRTPLPFKNFDSNLDGSGIVSNGKKYGGFFFTSEFDNADFYSEWFICKVKIDNIQPNPIADRHTPTVLKKAVEDNTTYLIEDILDGACVSDVVIVPNSRLTDIHIIEWEFVGDEDMYFEYMDRMFYSGEEDDDYISKYAIEDMVGIIGGDIDYLLTIPIFKDYYESKE